VAALRQRIIEFFESSYVQAEVLVPFSEQRLLAEMHASMNVLGTRYEEAGVFVQVRADAAALDRLRARLPAGAVALGAPAALEVPEAPLSPAAETDGAGQARVE
jgi:hypothetical protein